MDKTEGEITMKRKCKRVLSVLFCVTVLMSTMSGTVFAAKKTKVSDKKIYKAYKHKIEAISESAGDDAFMYYYCFYDLTGDGVEELIIHGGSSAEAERVTYYTYKKGKTKKIGKTMGWHSSLGKDKKGKLIRYIWYMGGCSAYRVSYKKGKVKETHIFRYEGDSDGYKKKMKKAGLSESRLPTKNVDDLSLLKKHFPKH